MNPFERFVDRPVRAIVISLVILLLGVQGIFQLSTREYPETTSSVITVNTPYIGASADLVRGFITTPLEQAIATVDGIEYLKSTSAQGASTIEVNLVLGEDPDPIVAQVLTKIQQVSNQLPQSAENSVVTVQTGGDQAAMYIAFTSGVLSPSEITDYLNRAVRPQLETLQGVQQAQVFGAQSIAMRVWLDPRRLAALGVSASEVREVLERGNFLSALGETKGPDLSISLNADTDLDDVESFRRLVLRDDGDTLIRLGDVADVGLGAESYDTSVIFDGEPAVFIGVQVTPQANLLDAVGRVRELLPSIRERIPDGLEMQVAYDSTVAVQSSIDQVIVALVQALAIVAAVIFLFLGSWRSVLVPSITMPLAIVGAFFLMQLAGYTINLLTLLALILAIGTVVDDAIVITENASRHIENGEEPREAAKRTVRELTGSVIAMNIVVVAVFAPVGFVGGLTGTLFTEFAYTVAGATLVSGVVALTLSPMMCARLLKGDMKKIGPSRWVDRGFEKLSGGYANALSKALDLRWFVLGLGALLFASLFFLWNASERELAPDEDGGFLGITAQADPNSSIDQLQRWTSSLESSIGEKFDAVDNVFFINGGGRPGSAATSAFGGVSLKDWDEREPTQQTLQPQVQGTAAAVPGLQAVVISPASLPGAGGGAPVQFIISSIQEPRAVFENAQAIIDAANESGLFQYVESDLKFDRLQTTLEIDRERAASLGVDIDRLAGDLSTLLAGNYVNFFTYDGRSYRVVPQVPQAFRTRAQQVRDYYVAAGDDGLVPLSSVATLADSVEPRQLLRFNQLNAAILSGVPAPGVSIGEIVTFLQDRAAEELPSGYVTDWAGQARQYVSESSSLLLAFGLAVALMYLTLAAQYGSFRDPAVMLVSVPMSLAGALLFFALGVLSINIYTQIGLLALIGAIIRHGILLVEFANDLQVDEGLDRRAAIERAASLRFRAILMTTTSTVVGVIPLIVAGSGPGAESRFAISFTLGVGMAIGTVFTLFVVPALYTVLATRRSSERSGKRDGGRDVASASS